MFKGTLAILKAALEENVKKVVLTSSVVTFLGSLSENRIYSEKEWLDVNKIEKSFFSAYQKSKILAEKAAWDFYEEYKSKGKCFDFATVLPSLTLGPLLHPNNRTSIDFFLTLLDRKKDRVDGFAFPICDVRDLALAHLKVAELDEAVGHRFTILSSQRIVPAAELAEILKKAGYKVGNVQPCNSESKIDDSNMRNILKIQPIDIEKSVLDTMESLIKLGVVNP